MVDEKNSNYNHAKVEEELVAQVREIKNKAETYGEKVDVVGRRSVFAEGDGRGNGYKYEYKLSDGRIVNGDEAWELANAGRLNGVVGSHNHGRKHIKNVGDGNVENNLGNLPSF